MDSPEITRLARLAQDAFERVLGFRPGQKALYASVGKSPDALRRAAHDPKGFGMQCLRAAVEAGKLAPKTYAYLRPEIRPNPLHRKAQSVPKPSPEVEAQRKAEAEAYGAENPEIYETSRPQNPDEAEAVEEARRPAKTLREICDGMDRLAKSLQGVVLSLRGHQLDMEHLSGDLRKFLGDD